jgi:hypothetical protein
MPCGRKRSMTRLLGAAVTLFDGYLMDPPEQAEFDRDHATARAQLGEDAFTAAWAAGRAMSLEQAIAEALGEHS